MLYLLLFLLWNLSSALQDHSCLSMLIIYYRYSLAGHLQCIQLYQHPRYLYYWLAKIDINNNNSIPNMYIIWLNRIGIGNATSQQDVVTCDIWTEPGHIRRVIRINTSNITGHIRHVCGGMSFLLDAQRYRLLWVHITTWNFIGRITFSLNLFNRF